MNSDNFSHSDHVTQRIAELSNPSRRNFVGGMLAGLLASAAFTITGCSKKRPLSNYAEYRSYDAMDLAHLVRRGDADPMQLLEIAIARAEAINPTINFMATPLYDRARKLLETQSLTGELAGVPFLLKDLSIHLKDTRITSGSRLFKDYHSTYTSTLAQRYEDAGLVIFGKTTSPEFGGSVTTESILFGQTRNPWNIKYSAGGSSGGSAAAVAAGVLPVAHGSDGGGSIRIPASSCGLFGLKPSRGRVPYGPVAIESTLSAMHVISRTVRDSALLLDLTAGGEKGSPYVAPSPEKPFLQAVTDSSSRYKKLKIGVMNGENSGITVEDDCIAALDDAVALCQTLGHDVAVAPWPKDSSADSNSEILSTVMAAGGVDRLTALEEKRGRSIEKNEIENLTWVILDQARDMTASQYLRAKQGMLRIALAIADAHSDFDVVLSPTMGALPALLGTVDTSQSLKLLQERVIPYAFLTSIYNMTGQPAMSVPLYWNHQSLPVGVMFAAPLNQEYLLFNLAGQLERARPWRHLQPSLT